MRLGEALRKERKVRGLSLRDLEALAGVPFPTIVRIERRRVKTPGFYIVAKIAKALGLSLDRLAELKA
jgi:transcriptional regulator with XRE-family HTH domain